MTFFFDGNKVIGVSMHKWEGTNLSPDFSSDFFEVGGLPKEKIKIEGKANLACLVKNCDRIVEQMTNYWFGEGDYTNDFETEEDRYKHRYNCQFYANEFDFERSAE